MTSISRFDPVREAMSLRHAMDQLLSQSFVNPTWSAITSTAYTPMDVCETEQGYKVRVSLPGVRPEEVDVTLEQNTLTIKGRFSTSEEERERGEQREQHEQHEQREGERREGQERRNWLLHEITSGEFERSITFGRPIDAEHVEAKMEHGVLTLMIPLAQSSRPRKISVGGQQDQQQIPVEAGVSD